MTTPLDKVLRRRVTIDGADYTIAVDPEGVRVTGKGKRRPEVALRWRDLVSGEAAMAIALNASLTKRATATDPNSAQPPVRTIEPRSKKRAR